MTRRTTIISTPGKQAFLFDFSSKIIPLKIIPSLLINYHSIYFVIFWQDFSFNFLYYEVSLPLFSLERFLVFFLLYSRLLSFLYVSYIFNILLDLLLHSFSYIFMYLLFSHINQYHFPLILWSCPYLLSFGFILGNCEPLQSAIRLCVSWG